MLPRCCMHEDPSNCKAMRSKEDGRAGQARHHIAKPIPPDRANRPERVDRRYMAGRHPGRLVQPPGMPGDHCTGTGVISVCGVVTFHGTIGMSGCALASGEATSTAMAPRSAPVSEWVTRG